MATPISRKLKDGIPHALIFSALRKVNRYDPCKQIVKVAARRERGQYECAIGKEIVGPMDFQIDHILPVVRPETVHYDWNEVVRRMWPGVSGYQLLCIPCHERKTAAEGVIRHATKRALKEQKNDPA